MPELRDVEFALTDISEHNLVDDPAASSSGWSRPTACRPGSPRPPIAARRSTARATSSTARASAASKPTGDDIEIPLKYGVDQCVGDTICAGGILYGQRNIPAILDFCRDIREVAEPGARFLNYANPMAMNTWAAIDYGKVDTIGLCHGVQHGGEQIAAVLGAGPGELDFICAGINHQTWYIDIRLRGRQVGRDELVAAFERHPVYSQQEKVRIDVLKRFGFYSTESNGHLSEYLPWYRKRPDEIARWIDMSDWIHGETGGYLRHCTETRELVRDRLSRSFSRKPAEPIDPRAALDRARQLHHRGAGDRPRLSRPLQRQEQRPDHQPARPTRSSRSPGFVDRFGLNMVAGITLPDACAATCIASINVQRMSVHAAIDRRCRAAEARGAARSAGRRDLLARRGLADGRRDAGRPGRMAAAIRRRHRRPRSSGSPQATSRRATGRAPRGATCARSRIATATARTCGEPRGAAGTARR